MNILRVSTLSLGLAIAVFALGYVSPSFADKPDDKGKHGQHSGDDGTETFSVEVITTVGGIYGVNTPVDCAGTTDKNLSVDFLTNCPIPDVMAGGVPLFLAGIAVRDKRLDAIFFFSTMQLNFPNGNPGEWYESRRLSVTIVDGALGDFYITVTNPPGGVVLIKSHEPNKRMTLAPIAIGNIVYTAN